MMSEPGDLTDEEYRQAMSEVETVLTAEQVEVLNSIRKRQLMLPDDIINLDSTGFDIIDGLSINLITGQLGLIKPKMLRQGRVDSSENTGTPS